LQLGPQSCLLVAGVQTGQGERWEQTVRGAQEAQKVVAGFWETEDQAL